MSKNFTPELIEQKRLQRLSLRNEFLKKITSPHHGDTGYVFDPALQRVLSMKATKIEHFKETPTTVKKGLFVILPLLAMIYYFKRSREHNEAILRRGEVAYKDRNPKFV